MRGGVLKRFIAQTKLVQPSHVFRSTILDNDGVVRIGLYRASSQTVSFLRAHLANITLKVRVIPRHML